MQSVFFTDAGINESILYVLKFITTDYIFFCVDDRIISSFCLEQFKEAILQAILFDVNSLRLNNCGEHSLRSNSTIGPLLRNLKYRVSFTNTLFKVSFLKSILSSGKTLWQLEASVPDEFGLKHYAPSYRFLVNPIVSQIHLIRSRKIISLSPIGSKIFLENKLPRASILFCLYQHAHSLFYPGIATIFALYCIICGRRNRCESDWISSSWFFVFSIVYFFILLHISSFFDVDCSLELCILTTDFLLALINFSTGAYRLLLSTCCSKST